MHLRCITHTTVVTHNLFPPRTSPPRPLNPRALPVPPTVLRRPQSWCQDMEARCGKLPGASVQSLRGSSHRDPTKQKQISTHRTPITANTPRCSPMLLGLPSFFEPFFCSFFIHSFFPKLIHLCTQLPIPPSRTDRRSTKHSSCMGVHAQSQVYLRATDTPRRDMAMSCEGGRSV